MFALPLQWLTRNLDKVDFPFIVFHSENDTMCDSDGSKALYEKAAVRERGRGLAACVCE